MNPRREIFIALPVKALKRALSKLERWVAVEIYLWEIQQCSSDGDIARQPHTCRSELARDGLVSAEISSAA
jgi:hypothetical protein